jgi:predicted acylesterase/phospholipase RssA
MTLTRVLSVAFAALLLAGCASLPRAPAASTDRAYISNIPHARMSTEDAYRAFAGRRDRTTALTILALSGGGADGSYGAGFLKGWSESGSRPDFDIVTGSSVGSLIAPFAFLGRQYDADLEAIFTSGVAEDLLRVAGINAVAGSGVFKAGPMKDLIAKYADDRLINAVAGRYRTGKLLVIATTNLDAQRTTLWNMGEIAASDSPDRFELFRSILAASAAIPGLLPPVFINVQIAGVNYSEMHIDGGVTSNVLAVPEQVLASQPTSPSAKARVFVIVNGKLSPDPATTPDFALPIVARAFQTSVKANTRSAMISTYDFCRRNDWQFNATAIDAGRAANQSPTDFNTNYMTELYAYGYAKGASGRGFQQNLDGLKGAGSLVAAGSR